MPLIELFEGKSITWILLVSLIVCIGCLAMFTKDFVQKTVDRFQAQMNAQQERSELREAKLMEELKISNQNNSRFSELLSSFEKRFDKVDLTLSKVDLTLETIVKK